MTTLTADPRELRPRFNRSTTARSKPVSVDAEPVLCAPTTFTAGPTAPAARSTLVAAWWPVTPQRGKNRINSHTPTDPQGSRRRGVLTLVRRRVTGASSCCADSSSIKHRCETVNTSSQEVMVVKRVDRTE